MFKLFKRPAGLLLIMTMLFAGSGIVHAQASTTSHPPVRVVLDANTMTFGEQPFIEKSTTLVPFRPIFEKLGLTIGWDPDTRTVTGEKEGIHIELQIDNPVAKVNGKSITLPVAPKLKNKTTFVPLRFISESVESKVEWDSANRTAVIYSKNRYASADGQFQFNAYGLWRNMSGLENIVAEDDELVQDYISVEEAGQLQLALRYFNHTMLFIAADPLTDETRDMKLDSYLDRAKDTASLSSKDIVEEKQIELFGYDALQLTYVNHLDWDKRIDTLVVFKTGSRFYSIRNSSYEVTYKNSIQDFEDILEDMEFREQ
ncbi:copper amine oxidase N-terminal domain-containing protein [Paenibacillus sp. PAMC21692]|uniref:copper amine oxidase N-terminal domain-containing protein n=1 Tax=Paenibacillus sp. PAMC21692 TaxID=2762320 RepID=UPI00164D68F3|nr:copper amine oxidase N-terminal domain-containing protein [Paenibacillus sp. PAMC21692]QNK57607.1 copper amine oxidase N-terminal domain-containing protein [Paenibacillus sp. PAMC21692]